LNTTALGLEKKLTWPSVFLENGADISDVSCDPVEKKHIFSVPKGKGKENSGFVRCLCHALLAEEVHPLFSAVIVEGPEIVPENIFKSRIWPVFCVSRDWFADALLKKLYPEESRSEIGGRLARIARDFPGGRIDGAFSSLLEVALVLAEAEYLWHMSFDLDGAMRRMSDVFCQVDPMVPELTRLEALNDSLLKKYSSFSVRLAENAETGGTFWRVF